MAPYINLAVPINTNSQTLILLSRASVKLSTAFIIHTKKGIYTGHIFISPLYGLSRANPQPRYTDILPAKNYTLTYLRRKLSHPTIVPFQCIIYSTSLCRLRPSPVKYVETTWKQRRDSISDNLFTIHNLIACTVTAGIIAMLISPGLPDFANDTFNRILLERKF